MVSARARPTLLGGLSNVWGSGLLPYTDQDLAGWPITASDLAEGYRAVLDFCRYAGEDDELARALPAVRAARRPAAPHPRRRSAARPPAPPSRLPRRSRLSLRRARAWRCASGTPRPGTAASTADTAWTAAPTATSTTRPRPIAALTAAGRDRLPPGPARRSCRGGRGRGEGRGHRARRRRRA